MEVKDFEKKIGALTIMEVIGRVTKITKDESKSGKPYWKVTVDGNEQPLFVWSFGAIANVKINGGARFEVEQRGNFLHVIKAEPTTNLEDFSEPEDPTTPPEASKPKVTARDAKDNPYITRMSALKTAVDYFNLVKANADAADPSLEEVVAVATRFVEFVETGE
jgi:hypothetical protein